MISQVVMYHEGDKQHLKGCLDSLIKDEEIILVKTIKDDKDEFVLTGEGKLRIEAEIYYKEMDFGKLRNMACALATQQWILWLDADERLMNHQHTEIKELVHYSHNNIGGFVFTNISTLNPDYSPPDKLTFASPQVKLFKNIPYPFEFPVHETVERNISAAGFKMVSSAILVHHVGYNVSKEVMESKYERNKELIIKHDLHNSFDEHVKEKYNRCLLDHSKSILQMKMEN